ncbi:OLC1v1007730C1 [Oldenlandia corymbosa var. corymbosa]|uniref:OLC1v1007730C1 n=1 Tax=Oldenlandia corymbosa var. corymbosa TaxID=529605 RepID=A0AAV1DLD6_OLDCO|nr:OLC1v1007730C1 [Oldenlandia corymbosa var. corymbosa]
MAPTFWHYLYGSISTSDIQHPNRLIIMFSISFTFIILILSAALTLRKNKKKQRLRLPPGSFGWPILGETLEFLNKGKAGEPDAFVKERMHRYGGTQVFKTSLTGNKVAVLCGPAGNKFLFGNENKVVQLWWPLSAKKLLGNGLSNRVGEEARRVRKMVGYFVSPDALMRLYINTVDQVTRQHLNSHWAGKQVVKTFPVIKSYTFELACRLFMSLEDPHHIAKLASLFNVFLKGVISIPLYIPGTRFYRASRATSTVRKELSLLLQHRRSALLSKTASPSQDLLSHLLASPDDHGNFMSESEIINNVLLLLFAGHDTSSVTITLLLKTLGELPHVYEHVRQEQLEIASSKAQGEFLGWEDIQKMKYSWNVVCEVMRLWPPIMGAFREALVDLNYAGYDIPKGWKLYWTPASTQKEPDLFPDPTRFDPCRFEGAGPKAYSYVPFGGGPRMCLGKEYARVEILVFLHNLVKDFRWSLIVPDEKIIYDPMPTPVQGLPVRLQPHECCDKTA